ncbi:MAG: hypothetical protein V1797_04650 [Pseudomonadota bacterium]
MAGAPAYQAPAAPADIGGAASPARDVVGEVLGVVDRALRLVAGSSEAREAAGLTGVSQFILGRPGWYLWPTAMPGAFGLELAACQASGLRQSQGSFWVKYYPALDSPLLARFAGLERLVRDSDYFDRTGTPTLDGALELPEDLFVVGRLDYGLDRGRPRLCLHLEAPERWDTVCQDGLSLAGPEGAPLLDIAPGSPDRRLPAWELAYGLGDRLLRLICLAYRVRPRRVGLGQAEDAGGTGLRRHLRADLELRHEHGPRPLLSLAQLEPPDLLPTAPAAEWAVHHHAPASPMAWINPDWWEVGRRHYSAAGAAPC